MKSSSSNQSLLNFQIPRPVGFMVVVALSALIFLVDVFTTKINLPILYILPLLIYAQTMHRQGLVGFALFFAFLTLGKYVGEGLYHKQTISEIFVSYRLINRSMVVMALLVSAFLLHRWIRFREQWAQQRTALKADGEQPGRLFFQTMQIMERTIAILLSAVLCAAIFSLDLISPGQFNLPILYIIPLLIIGLSCSWRMTSICLVLMILLAILGYFVGPTITINSKDTPLIYIQTNRFMACAGLSLVGGILYILKRLGL